MEHWRRVKLEITVKWAVLLIQRLYKASLSWLLWQKKGEPLFKTESRIQRGPLCSSQDLFRFFSRLKGPPPLLKCFRIMLNKRTKLFYPIYQSNNIRSNINQQFDTQSRHKSYQRLKRYQQFIIYQRSAEQWTFRRYKVKLRPIMNHFLIIKLILTQV